MSQTSAIPTDLPGSPPARKRNFVVRYFARYDDGELVRWIFRGMLLGAIGVLALDLHDMWTDRSRVRDATTSGLGAPAILPPAVHGTGDGKVTVDPRDNITGEDEALRAPVTFTLLSDGVLAVDGYIDNGALDRFRAELDTRGEYVETVRLNSPGGSLDDAIGMAQLLRERNVATEVVDGALCASSCPLILAGGATRTVGAKAAVGLHQFYSVSADPSEPAQAMSDAQATTARISRHLAAMGVDPALWLHALDTPPRSLYYLSPDEIRAYRLASGNSTVATR